MKDTHTEFNRYMQTTLRNLYIVRQRNIDNFWGTNVVHDVRHMRPLKKLMDEIKDRRIRIRSITRAKNSWTLASNILDSKHRKQIERFMANKST